MSEKEKIVLFEVRNEKFHEYLLEDDSLLKVKFILTNIIEKPKNEEDGKKELLFQSINIVGIFSPEEIRGERDKSHSTEELEKYITQKNLMFKTLNDAGRNYYETKEFNLIIDYRVKSIDKTSKFDSMGMPAYIVRAETEIIVEDKVQS